MKKYLAHGLAFGKIMGVGVHCYDRISFSFVTRRLADGSGPALLF